MMPDPRKIADSILSKDKPGPDADPVEAAAQDLIDALGTKSAKGVAEAVRSMFELIDQDDGAGDEQ